MNEVKPPKKSMIYYYLIMIVVLLCINAWIVPALSGQKIQEVDYSTFLNMLNEKSIAQVEIQDNQIAFNSNQEGNKQIYVTGRIEEDTELVNRLQAAGVQFSRVIEQESSPLVAFLITWLGPILIIVLFGQIFMRSMKKRMGGQNAMIFGGNDRQPVCAYSGELPAWKFKYWASLQAAGPKNLQVRKDQLSGREIPHPTPFAQQMIDEWWRGRFLLYDIGTSTYHDAANILRVFRYAHRRYGAKVYLVDNLMTARFRGNDRDFYRAQSEFVAELASFAHDNNVHVHLVAHPRKTDRISDSDEVAGIGDVTNLADNVYVLEKEEREDRQQDSVLTILKNRFFGERGRSIGLNFERKSKRFYKSGTGNPDKVYGWALSGRQAVVDLPEGGEDPFP